MISGRQALARLEQAIRTLREREAQLQQAWHAAAEEAARLRVERTETFRQLARLKLDALTRNEVDGELDGAGGDRPRAEAQALRSRPAVHVSLAAKVRQLGVQGWPSDPLHGPPRRPGRRLRQGEGQLQPSERNSGPASLACSAHRGRAAGSTGPADLRRARRPRD